MNLLQGGLGVTWSQVIQKNKRYETVMLFCGSLVLSFDSCLYERVHVGRGLLSPL